MLQLINPASDLRQVLDHRPHIGQIIGRVAADVLLFDGEVLQRPCRRLGILYGSLYLARRLGRC